MKKLFLAVAAAAALSLTLSSTPASADPNFSQICKDNGDFGLSHGECTSILNGFYGPGQGTNDVAAYCKAVKAVDPAFFDAVFGNVGQCIKALRPYF